jgi:predicted Zn-ribbon and HTH transcriptional regulator
MTLRKQLMDVLAREPRSVSSLAREIGLPRADVEDALQHMIKSARAAGHGIVVVPARCRSCGFTFGEERLTRPSKCPECRNSRIFEPQIGVDTTHGGT